MVSFFAIAIAVATLLSGCGPAIVTQVSIPPQAPEAAHISRVSVVGFSGRRAEEVNAIFETSLVNHRFNGVPYFTVVDRKRTRDLMREYGSAMRGEIDPSTAARYGKQIGAQGIYFGEITRADINQTTSRNREKYCARYDSSGRRCSQWAERQVTCYNRVATVTIAPRLIDVESSQVVYRGIHSGEARSSKCGSQSSRGDADLMQEAIRSAVSSILVDIAPRNEAVRVNLMDKPSVLAEDDAAEFARGLAFAREQRMDRACDIWGQLNQKTGDIDNALLYNIAMCREISGDYGQALTLLEKIDQRLDLPDRNISSSLNRLRTTLQTQ